MGEAEFVALDGDSIYPDAGMAAAWPFTGSGRAELARLAVDEKTAASLFA